jgi:uncharacterized protein
MRFLISIGFVLALCACNELAQKIGENLGKAHRKSDSLEEARKERPVDAKRLEILDRKKEGGDSLYLIRQFYLTGQKFSDFWTKRDMKHGAFKMYYKSGVVCYSAIYDNDRLWEMTGSFFPDEKKRDEVLMKNGTGNVKLYHPVSFKLFADINYKNGLQHGSYHTWYENGNKHEAARFENGATVGDFEVWYKAGPLKQRRIVNAQANSVTFMTYHENGNQQLHQVIKDEKTVLLKTWNEHGLTIDDYKLKGGELRGIKFGYFNDTLISKGEYLHNFKDGNYEYLFTNGKKQAVEVYKRDTMVSEKRWNSLNNLVLETYYVNGREQGVRKEYYDNGQLKLVAEYLDGERHGSYVSYFINGNLYNEGRYFKGKPNGEMKFHSRDGKKVGSKTYE